MLCRVNARAAGERNWPTTGWPIASPGACRGAPARTTVQRESLFVERESLLAEQKGSPVERETLFAQRETLFVERESLFVEPKGFSVERERLFVQRKGSPVEQETLFAEREGLFVEGKGSPGEQKGSRVERETRPRDKKRGVAGWPRPCRGPANAGRLRGRQLDRRLHDRRRLAPRPAA